MSRYVSRDGAASAGALAASVEPGGKNASVVEDHQVTGLQEAREVAKLTIKPFAGTALHVQQSGRIAGGKRLLGDEFVGKVEVELRNQHESDYRRHGGTVFGHIEYSV